MTLDFDDDHAVIGAGPAGQRGAVAVATLGKRVAIPDQRELVGGVPPAHRHDPGQDAPRGHGADGDERSRFRVRALMTRVPELVLIGQAVMALGGTIACFRRAVFNSPTLAEASTVAGLDGTNRL